MSLFNKKKLENKKQTEAKKVEEVVQEGSAEQKKALTETMQSIENKVQAALKEEPKKEEKVLLAITSFKDDPTGEYVLRTYKIQGDKILEQKDIMRKRERLLVEERFRLEVVKQNIKV